MTDGPGAPRLGGRGRTRLLLAGAGLALFAGAAGIFLVPFAFPTPPPIITAFRGTQAFSPAIAGQQATILIRVRERSTVTLEIRSDDGVVSTLIDDEPLPAGWMRAVWDGRDAEGEIVGDGEYRVRLRARSDVSSQRVFNVSRRVSVDATPPRVMGFGVRSADADTPGPAQCRTRLVAPEGNRARFAVRRDGRTIAEGPTVPLDAEGRAAWDWDGRNIQGEPAVAGVAEIRATVIDAAGNRTRRAATCWVGHLTGRVAGRAVPNGRVGVRLRGPDGSAVPGDTRVSLALYERAGTPGQTIGGVLGARVAGRATGPASDVSVRLPRRPVPGRLWLVARTDDGLALIDARGR